MVIAHSLHHVTELGFAIDLGTVDVLTRKTVLQHLLVGFAIQRLTNGRLPASAFVETLGAGLVDEVAVQQTNLGQGDLDAVARSFDPLGTCLMHVDAQPNGAVVDAHQMVVGEDAFAQGVYHHFIGN